MIIEASLSHPMCRKVSSSFCDGPFNISRFLWYFSIWALLHCWGNRILMDSEKGPFLISWIVSVWKKLHQITKTNTYLNHIFACMGVWRMGEFQYWHSNSKSQVSITRTGAEIHLEQHSLMPKNWMRGKEREKEAAAAKMRNKNKQRWWFNITKKQKQWDIPLSLNQVNWLCLTILPNRESSGSANSICSSDFKFISLSSQL